MDIERANDGHRLCFSILSSLINLQISTEHIAASRANSTQQSRHRKKSAHVSGRTHAWHVSVSNLGSSTNVHMCEYTTSTKRMLIVEASI